MAGAQAFATGRSNLKDNMNMLMERDTIILRAIGKHNNLTVYCVIDTYSRSNILCYLEVAEATQAIEVKPSNLDGTTVITGSGGLENLTDIMRVCNPNTNRQIGSLNNNSIVDCLSGMFKISYPLNYEFQLNMRISIHHAADRRMVAFIYQSGGSEAALQIVNSAMNSAQRFLCLMTMLKLYHAAFKFHQYPIPRGILSRLPGTMRTQPSLALLGSIQETYLRAACKTGDVKWMELYSVENHKIVFVIEFRNLNGEVYFRDPCGTLQFKSAQGHGKNPPSAVYTHANILIGSSRKANYGRAHFNPNGLKPVMFERRIGTAFNEDVQFLGTDHCKTKLAHIRMPVVKSIIHVNMLPASKVEHKAMILTSAVRRAIFHYEMFSIPLPKIEQYNFRQCA